MLSLIIIKNNFPVVYDLWNRDAGVCEVLNIVYLENYLIRARHYSQMRQLAR